MTVAKLHKLLGTLIDEGHGRKRMCVDKSSFTHPLEADGALILNVEDMQLKGIPMIDDDGGVRTLADGSESYHNVAVLTGCA